MSQDQAPYEVTPRPPALRALSPGIVKYVVLQRGGMQIPITGPADAGLEHVTLALCGHVVSAGFADTATWTAYGESVGMGIKSRPEHDTALLRKYFMGSPS